MLVIAFALVILANCIFIVVGAPFAILHRVFMEIDRFFEWLFTQHLDALDWIKKEVTKKEAENHESVGIKLERKLDSIKAAKEHRKFSEAAQAVDVPPKRYREGFEPRDTSQDARTQSDGLLTATFPEYIRVETKDGPYILRNVWVQVTPFKATYERPYFSGGWKLDVELIGGRAWICECLGADHQNYLIGQEVKEASIEEFCEDNGGLSVSALRDKGLYRFGDGSRP